MTVFILVAAALAVLAALLVAWPLLKRRNAEADDRAKGSRAVAVAVIVFLPLVSFLLYFQLSHWWSADHSTSATHQAGNAASLETAAAKLEDRLRREQGDAEGWKMLGRTYVVMGNFPKALDAYQHAYTLTSGADIESLLGYAEAKVLVNENEFEGEAGKLFEHAIQLAPEDPRALWYAGFTAYRKQELAKARKYWSTLKQLGPPQEILQAVDDRLADIEQKIGPDTAAVASSSQQAATPAAPATLPTVAADSGEGIPLRVELAPQLAGRAPADATLFVMARGGGGGPPLAAIRRSSSSLPLDLTLSDADAMIPGTSLRQVDALTLVARISLTGRPIAATGDLFGEVRYDPASKGRITLMIDRVVD